MSGRRSVFVMLAALPWATTGSSFEGRVRAAISQCGETQSFLYTVGTNWLRIERVETNWPYARNIIRLDTDAVTLLFPHNRSFVRLKPASDHVETPLPGWPPPAMGGAELRAIGATTSLLGYACTRYELNARGATMEIWATDQLLPFRPWRQQQPTRVAPRIIDGQWHELLKAKKLFPLLVMSRGQDGAERFRFEVDKITPESIKDPDGVLFQPAPEYHEIEPLPF